VRNSSPQPHGVLERVERSVLGSNKKDYRRQIPKVGGTVGTKRTFQGVDEVLLSIRDCHIHAKNRVACFCSEIGVQILE
jgi:hypothetical protein